MGSKSFGVCQPKIVAQFVKQRVVIDMRTNRSHQYEQFLQRRFELWDNKTLCGLGSRFHARDL